MRVLIDAGIEGYHGTALADSGANPRVAQLSVGAFTLFGGDPEHPAARALIQEHPRQVVPESEAWCDLMIQTYGDHLGKREHIGFSSEKLDIDHLRALAKRAPEGFQIKRVDMDLADQMVTVCSEESFLAFPSLKDFVERGVGFCATEGDRVVSGAASYVKCDAGIEVTIVTHPDFRQKGLATAVGATLMAHCLERGLNPHWNASNSISARLAIKLGYVQDDVYEILRPLIRKEGSLSEEHASQGFRFEHLVALTDPEIQVLLGEVAIQDMAIALQGADERIQGRIFDNMSERLRARLRKEVGITAGAAISDVEDVRGRIAECVRQLAQMGQINWPRSE